MEQKVKKRGWIKNAAIIFLAVMLVLTFFSNTIMNRSLPEAATQVVTSGSIVTKVRGTGTVSAKENYEVILDQTRKVNTVFVKTGQNVSVGDVLFTLETGDSSEVEAAREALRQLQIAYQKALISAGDSDFAKENREVEKAKTALAEAQANYAKYNLDDENAIPDAKKALEAAKEANTAAQRAFEQWKAENMVDGKIPFVTDKETAARKAAIAKAKEQYEIDKLLYSDAYEEMKVLTRRLIRDNFTKDERTAYWELKTTEERNAFVDERLETYLPAVAALAAGYTIPPSYSSSDYDLLSLKSLFHSYVDNGDYPLAEQYNTAYTTLTGDEDKIAELEESYEEYLQSDKTAQYTVEKAKADAAAKAQTDAEDLLTKMQAASTAVEECQTALETALDALAQSNKSAQLQQIDLNEQAREIKEKQAELDELTNDEGELEVKSKVNGVVKTLSVSAGRKAEANSTLAVIEVPDLGYTMSFSVTNEQARRVRVGDSASVTNYYWGSTINAVLTAIKTDPQNPQSSKLLTFDVTGDVSDGTSLTLSVGQKSSDYDLVVPNSAIRKDSNGSFVLVVTVKSSPLGNRYTATRVDVEVIASDDTSSAVTGALNQNDYVITTSSKPITSGDMVRLPDNL